MKINNKKTIIFDFDGTIADSLDEIINELYPEISKKYNLSKKEIKYLVRNKSLKKIIEKFKVNKLKIILITIIIRRNIRKNINLIKPFENTKETLQYLIDNNYELGLITSNEKKLVKQFLIHYDLEKYFKHFLFKSSIFNKEKSFKKYFIKYKLNKDNTLYIGDELRDLKSCSNINLDCIGVTYGFNSKKLLEKEKSKYLIGNINQLQILL